MPIATLDHDAVRTTDVAATSRSDTCRDVPGMALKQRFVTDPNGSVIDLNDRLAA